MSDAPSGPDQAASGSPGTVQDIRSTGRQDAGGKSVIPAVSILSPRWQPEIIINETIRHVQRNPV